MTDQMQTTVGDVMRSARMWPIWTRLGLQDVRLKFRRSALGPAWILVNLAVLVTAIGFIYANLLRQDPREFMPYLTIGLVMWLYLTNSIVEGGNAFVNSEGYIKQISLPIYVYLFRAFVSVAVTMLIPLLASIVVLAWFRVPLASGTLFAVPGLLIFMAASLLLITIFAHLNARFRDVAHVATIGMNVLFYATPVLFPADLLRRRGNLRYVIDLNPAYHLIELVRHPLVSGAPAASQSYLAAAIIVATLGVGAAAVIAVFQRRIVFAL
jgi:ABC-2 type transport system permease protein/lipopolysaccharide transport system permease protein